MGKKTKLLIKVVIILCILILVVDVLVLLYKKNINDKKKTFFESLNSYVIYKDNYYGVGSNNINRYSYERATLTKYNSNYKKVWSNTFDSKFNSTYYNISRDGDNLLAVGSYEKNKDENKDSLRTALFVKYDKNGNIVFKKDLQILGNSKFTNVLVLDDGYIVVGQSIYPNDVLGNEQTGGAIIVKYSKNGKVIWQRNAGGNKSGLFNDVILDGENLYAVGKDATRYGIIVKYSLDGNEEKAVSYAKTDTLGFSSIVKKKDNFIVVGAKKVKEDDEYDHDINGLIVEYNRDLDKINENVFSDKKGGLERFNKVIVNKKNNIVVVGHEAVLDKEKSTKEKNAYSYRGIIVKYDNDLKVINSEVYHKNEDDYFTDLKESNGIYVVSGYHKYNSNSYKTFFKGFERNF